MLVDLFFDIGDRFVVHVDTLSFSPVTSAWRRFDLQINPRIRDEIGRPELVKEATRIYTGLPNEDKSKTGIIAINFSPVCSVDLNGPKSSTELTHTDCGVMRILLMKHSLLLD